MALDVTRTEPAGLRAGDLIVAHGLQRRAGAGTAAGSAMPALQFGDLVVLPNLGEPVSPASDLVFAFEAFAEPGAGATESSVVVMQDGHPASTPVTLQLSPARDSGRIAYVGHIPIGMLAPANCFRADTPTRAMMLTGPRRSPCRACRAVSETPPSRTIRPSSALARLTTNPDTMPPRRTREGPI
jgi:hypothetical protein